jgi:hypothetical protein
MNHGSLTKLTLWPPPAYLSVLHAYESFGWWRRADYLKVHFAESWNELHHLLIMEALGGDKRWLDRFLAQHVAVAYYTVAALLYILSPRMACESDLLPLHLYLLTVSVRRTTL